MDLGFWRHLTKEDGNKLRLRQRIPEVYVFQGCHLDSCYSNNASGLLVRKRVSKDQDVEIRAMHDNLVARVAHSYSISNENPVAILRTAVGTSKIPQASVLTAAELNNIVFKLLSGQPPWGVPPLGAGETNVWSIQAFIEPRDDVRIISVYSCDVSANEKSDIFGRIFHKVYRSDRTLVLPTPESVGAEDPCLSLPSAQRSVIETKTLSVVRFISRFYKLDFEGLVLEFIFDSKNKAILHACWAATVFGNEPRKKILPSRLGTNQPRSEAPKVFPVPEVESESEEHHLGGAADVHIDEGAHGSSIDAFGLSSLTQEVESRRNSSPLERRRNHQVVKACTLLLEVWDGEDFLGEVAVNCAENMELAKQLLPLGLLRERAFLRKDDRKDTIGTTFGSLVVSLKWMAGDPESADFLRFGPVLSQDLRPDSGLSSAARLVLWIKASGDDEFSPVWASREVQHAANPAWNETVDLSLPQAAQPSSCQRVEQQTASAVGSGGAAVRQRRPLSARGRLESPKPFASASVASATASTHCPIRAQSEFAFQHDRAFCMQSTRESPIELETTISSPHDCVLGAGISSHWGMSDTDGNMCTHMLASQVLQRLRLGGMNASTRSALLVQLSGQLKQFHELQLSWDEQFRTTRETLAKAEQELEERDANIDKIRAETQSIAREREQKLAHVCREMCAGIDDMRLKEHNDDNDLARSQHRLAEQTELLRATRARSDGIQNGLSETRRQFEELSRAYGIARDGLHSAYFTKDAEELADIALQTRNAQTRVASLTRESEEERGQLTSLKNELSCLKADLALESNHALKLERFVRRIAEGPSATMRRGGGFALDSAAKREAAGLLKQGSGKPSVKQGSLMRSF